jgi:aspartyl-tRNA(Asn)/glutamyl-tRNA(Gln) amidotransferase subunit C
MEIKNIEKLAELAKIEISETEKEGLLKDLEGILGYVKVIEGVEVDDVLPEYNLKNVWREDLPASGGSIVPREFSKDLIIGQFPESHDRFLKVKKIL